MRGVWTSGAKWRLLSCSVRRAAALTLAACVAPLGSLPLVLPHVAPVGSSFVLLLLLLLLRTSAALTLAAAAAAGAAVAWVGRCRAWW